MDFSLSEDQLLIRDAFRGCLSRHVTLDRIRQSGVEGTNRRSPVDEDLWQELVGMGLPGLLIPEDFGGTGLGMLEATVVAQELGRAAAPVPFPGACVVAPLAVLAAGSDAQKRDMLVGMARADIRCGVALAPSGLVCEAGVLSGNAGLVLDAAGATHILVKAGDTLYFVAVDNDGVSLAPEPAIDALQGLARLTLSQTRADLLPGSDAEIINRVTDAGRIALTAHSVGASEYLLQAAVSYAAERHQFGRAIGSFQAIKHMCAEMAAELQPAIALAWYAGYAYDQTPEISRETAALAKSLADETGRFIARTATEIHGGVGFSDLLGLHYWCKRIAFNRTMLGTPEALRQQVAMLQGI